MKDPEEINPYDLNSIKKFSLMKETPTITSDGTELENINSLQFRSLAIFHIQELEQKIKELEDYKDGMLQEFRVLQARIEAYRSYCERNGLAEL